VKVLKDIMKRLTEPMKLRLDLALQAARHTPNEQGITPAQSMHGWRAVTQLDRIRPRPARRVAFTEPPTFEEGQPIWFRVYGRRDNVKWAAGAVAGLHGTNMYLIVDEQGHLVGVRHEDQIRGRRPTVPPPESPMRLAEPPPSAAGPALPSRTNAQPPNLPRPVYSRRLLRLAPRHPRPRSKLRLSRALRRRHLGLRDRKKLGGGGGGITSPGRGRRGAAKRPGSSCGSRSDGCGSGMPPRPWLARPPRGRIGATGGAWPPPLRLARPHWAPSNPGMRLMPPHRRLAPVPRRATPSRASCWSSCAVSLIRTFYCS